MILTTAYENSPLSRFFVRIVGAALGMFVAAHFLGCTDEQPVGPVDPATAGHVASTNTSPAKFEILRLSDLVGELPTSLQKAVTVSATVTPERGGEINFLKSGKINNVPFSVAWTLRFPPGAVNNRMNIKMALAYDTLTNAVSTTFTPSPTSFNLPGLMNVTVTGLLDSTRLAGAGHVGFAYMNPATGQPQPQPADSISLDLATRQFRCVNAQVPHFSRYAFIRWAN